MNNLLETVWHESPVILGAIAGSEAFEVRFNEKHEIFKKGSVWNLDFSLFRHVGKSDITLLTRSIDSLTDEELLECKDVWSLHAQFSPVKYDSVLEIIKDAELWDNAPFFLYLLSIGIWTGSKEGVEVIE